MEGQGIDQMTDISDLAGIQITMTLEQLLRLVPPFHEGIEHWEARLLHQQQRYS
jgi:hypothetical protein